MSRYNQTLNWLFDQLPNFQQNGATGYKRIGLESIQNLANYLKNPECKFPSIHVAGTNGKGSTSHLLASVLMEAGYKVGLYTSPHLKDFRERIKINGIPITKIEVVNFIEHHRPFFEQNLCSFFEMTVGMAFDYFAKKNVDIAIVEVGLGGRLDATNILRPILSIITNIGLDHQRFLGNTRAQIAAEKAGIIKPQTPVVIGEKDIETQVIFEKLSQENEAPLIWAQDIVENVWPSGLKGWYQKENTKLVQAVTQQLTSFKISEESLKNGLLKVVQNTGLMGRWHSLGSSPTIIADVAHNKEGILWTMKQVAHESFNQLHIVFGVVADKDLLEICTLLPKTAQYYLCAPKLPRALDLKSLKQIFDSHGFKSNAYGSVIEAFETAKKHAHSTDFIYVGGSTFVVAEIL